MQPMIPIAIEARAHARRRIRAVQRSDRASFPKKTACAMWSLLSPVEMAILRTLAVLSKRLFSEHQSMHVDPLSKTRRNPDDRRTKRRKKNFCGGLARGQSAAESSRATMRKNFSARASAGDDARKVASAAAAKKNA
jgi:hypothetical protein